MTRPPLTLPKTLRRGTPEELGGTGVGDLRDEEGHLLEETTNDDQSKRAYPEYRNLVADEIARRWNAYPALRRSLEAAADLVHLLGRPDSSEPDVAASIEAFCDEIEKAAEDLLGRVPPRRRSS